MTADQAQAPLPLAAFFALLGVVAFAIAFGLLIEGEISYRRAMRDLPIPFEPVCDQELDDPDIAAWEQEVTA